MKRSLFNLATIASLILLTATLICSIKSYLAGESWSYLETRASQQRFRYENFAVYGEFTYGATGWIEPPFAERIGRQHSSSAPTSQPAVPAILA